MKKKVLSLLLALLIIACSLPWTAISAAAETLKGEESSAPIVSIEPEESYNTSVALAKPDASGYARFIIKATGEITEDITVYYATEDQSAIASAGDYEAKIGSVVLTKEKPQVDIAIKTVRADYSINVNVHNGSENYNYLSRSFLVKLTGVSGSGAKADKNKSQVECALLAEHSLEAYSFSGTVVLAPYTSYGRYNLLNVLKTDACSGGKTVYNTLNVNFPSNWLSDYVRSGLDAKLYMALQNAHIDESSWNSSAGVSVRIGDVTVYLTGEFHDNEEFGWGPALLHALYGIDGEDDKLEDYFDENYVYTRWISFDGKVVTIEAKKSDMESALENEYVIIRKNQYYGAPNSIPNDPGMFYIGIDESTLSMNSISLRLFSDGGYSRKLSGGDISFMLEDVTAPQIKTNSDGSYAIYHNFNTATSEDKLRLAIRFDEPVQIDGNNPYITGKINGIGTGVEPHPYAITFKYVGGSGTDTLYFESEYSGNHQITSITDLKFTYSDSIKDFAGEANAFSQSSQIVIDGFNLDSRTPVIKVLAADAKMSDWGKTKSVAVTVSNIGEEATLYYSWCAPGATPTFENKIALNNVSVNGTKTATIISEGDGVKKLYLKAVSRYGQEQTTVTIVNNASTTTQEYLGPYNFDNSAPTVDASKLLPQNGSSTFEKNYVIPAPTDAGAGFYEIKMYYVGTDKENHLIENKTFNASSFKDSSGKPRDLQFTLSAEEVGVYEGARREVTVFFTLTDAIGNTSGEVARHKVIFDTNTYMEIESAVPVSDFVDNTEVIDEGYTFIYNGNAQVSYTGAYYSFLMTVLESNVGGTLVVSVSKNGVVLEDGYTPTVTKIRVDDKSVYLARVDFTSPMSEGYYDLQLLSYESGTSTNDGADLISRVYRIYIGSGSGRLDEQISTGTVLVNKVYQLPQLSYFYYMNNNGTIGSIVKETYNGTNLAPSFSTEDKAYEYVLFNEYRDVYALTLTAELAEALNAGNSNAQKALGEETVAREGQVWIRYKSASWDGLKTPNSNDWVFYYYGTTEVLDVTHFSPLLTETLDSVAKRITARGQAVALTDFSLYTGGTGSLVDGLGAPYLSPLQIHAQDKRLNDENRNSIFATEITYTADTAIYSSDVVINGLEYTLIGNVTIPSESIFQYKRIDENGLEDEVWTDLMFEYGQRFGDVLIGGRYKIRELGEGGVSQFNVYVDNDAPMVLVTWKDKDGASQSQILNQSSEKEFRARSFKIVSIDAREYDKYSYVALYNTSNSKLYGVYMLSDLQRASVDIPDGNYYMVIADRSGNSYTMTVHINSSELKPEVVISKNVKIKFTCDRKESQIQEFYVKRNGVLVSGKYAPELEFTESGEYEFYVRDIYGNVFGPEIYEFDRVYPEVVNWKYRDETGHFVNYDSENKTKYFTVDSVFDGVYKISTSVNMRFQIPSNYAFTFLGTAPEYEVSLDGTVTIKTVQSFQLKVYYQKHPDVYTIYNCSADTSAPSIDATIEVVNPMPDELEELRLAIVAGSINAGTVLIPSKISYSPKNIQTKHLVNNEVVMSDLIKVNVHDESGLAYVYVYLEGNLIKELNATEYASSGIALSKAGEYKIVAEDTLGNKSEFVFKNGTPDSLRYTVDGIPMELVLSAFENFDENGNYKDSCFGNEAVSFVIAESMKSFFMVTDSDGQRYFVAFDVSSGTIREIYYCVDEGGNIVLKTSETVLLDGTNPQTAKNKEYAIYEIEETGVKIYASVNSYGNITLTLYASDERELTVEARFNTEDNEFYYTKTELSSFSADLTIQTTEGIMQAGESNDLIKLNRPFKISTNGFEQDKISYVQIYHSKINDFYETGFFDRDDIYGEGLFYEEEGFYFIRLVNKYGNESNFIVHISYKFDVISYSQLVDGEKFYYSSDYRETIYSNEKVIFEVYSSGVTVNVEKNGEAFVPVLNIENGITYIILSEEGSYAITLTDAYRNEIKKSVQIDKSELTFNEDLLTGYNENALKKDEGYTNQKLSVSKDVLDKETIYYLAVQYGDTTEVLYDNISAEKISLDESKLSNLIGNLGDGEYTLVVRNRYGAAATKVIHYRETPTLILEREIRSSTEAEAYDIDKAVLIGFWSNGELIFKTDAEYYVFTINGDKTECPKVLSFASSTQQAHTEYEITYMDEYGFSYSFKAYLVRQTLEITPDLSKDALDINGVLTTTENIAVLFSENASCTYTWNNSTEKTYTPGEKLTRDGVYRFVVTDYAGNMSTLTIKKDTTVEFAFVKVNSNAEIQNGGVVNDSKVNFQILNSDSAYIEKVFKDGVEQKDFTGSKFGDDGKWELIISDKLGNKSYFSFYIITKEKNGFAYTTPYEYFVTELWYDSGDGVKISYLKFVNHTDSSSSFEFNENGKYTVTMTSSVTGDVSQFEFTVNTTAPEVSLVGCGVGETTINDVTITGCKIGDTIRVYRATGTGEELVQEITVTSTSTKMPTVNEGGEYRIVVESEAGVETELNFVRKHVMNTEGSIFVIIVISIAVVGLFIGLIYRNKSKTDE